MSREKKLKTVGAVLLRKGWLYTRRMPRISGTSRSIFKRQASTTVPDFGADSDDDMAGEGGAKGEEGGAPSSMIVQFATLEGENKGPQIDVPLGSTVLQMEELMNQLLENKDKVWNGKVIFISGTATASPVALDCVPRTALEMEYGILILVLVVCCDVPHRT